MIGMTLNIMRIEKMQKKTVVFYDDGVFKQRTLDKTSKEKVIQVNIFTISNY
jgi:hypothetical protein